jgi:hypothetical protein
MPDPEERTARGTSVATTHRAQVTRARARTTSLQRHGRRLTRRVVWLAIALLVLYTGFLVRGSYAFSQDRSAPEIFPFFVWELFSRVPRAEQRSYGLRLTEMNGAPLAEAVYFEDSMLPTHQSSAAHNVINKIGHAYTSGDEATLERYRTIMETRYLHPLESGSYELVRRTYNVKERYDCDCLISETVVAEFTMGSL